MTARKRYLLLLLLLVPAFVGNRLLEKPTIPMESYDLVVVGAGLSGIVFAERARALHGWRSLVLEKRSHVGGNCYDFVNEHGIRVSQYGLHLFHTRHERVWSYVQEFADWIPYEHRVKGMVRDVDGVHRIVPIPPNRDTVNALFKENITSEAEMESWLEKRRPKLNRPPRNGEEMSMMRVGKDLYERIFKEYTKKQWDKYPDELAPSVLARLPISLGNDDRYFHDKHQALPSGGYTAMFERMIAKGGIDVRLGVDFFSTELPKHKLLVFTGPIDAYYASVGMPKLEYRSIIFETEHLRPKGGYFQSNVIINYPEKEFPFTRIVEYKHLPTAGDRKELDANPYTTVVREYTTDRGDPYYPVPNEKNQELYRKYQRLAEKERGVLFIGRLASYKYFNMDEAILNALTLFDKAVEDGLVASEEGNSDTRD